MSPFGHGSKGWNNLVRSPWSQCVWSGPRALSLHHATAPITDTQRY